MRIRKMTASDYESVDSLMAQVHALHVAGRPDRYRPVEHPCSREEFERMLQDPEKILLLAEEGKEPAGLCVVTIRNHTNPMAVEKRTAWLEDLCVSRPFRRQGIGRMLFETALARAKEAGARRLDLKVWEFNEPARDFYASLGMSTQCRILEKEL